MNACLKSPASDRRMAPGYNGKRQGERKRRNGRQKGAILIMALMIVSVVAGLAVKFTGDFQLGMARAESRWHGVQARAYLRGAENLAIYLLSEDEPEVDHPEEEWAQEAPPFEVEGGWILASVEDATSRLNLNNLSGQLDPNRAHNDWQRFSTSQRRFIRLLQSFEDQVPINEDEAIAILEAVVDWMSPTNTASGFGGAGADYYQSLDPAYLPANNAFVSVDELRMVRYITPELLELLRPYLVVLPPGEGGLNINTLPPKMLGTINVQEDLRPLSDMDVSLLMQDWPEEGYFADVSNFASSPAWQSIVSGSPNTDGLNVNSRYFLVNTQVSLVQQRRRMRSLIQRGSGTFEVVRRSDRY